MENPDLVIERRKRKIKMDKNGTQKQNKKTVQLLSCYTSLRDSCRQAFTD